MNRQTILLVDDETGILETQREMLEDFDYTVLTASDGQDALDIMQQGEVDLVISDVRMPRKNGYEMLREMREGKIDSDIIFVTGYGTIGSAVECMNNGASDYIEKPFDIFKLRDKIAAVLERRQRRRSSVNAPDAMRRVHDLREALGEHDDFRSVVRELLRHTRRVFSPDGMALILADDRLPQRPLKVPWGPLLKGKPAWLDSLSESFCAVSDPALFEPGELAARIPGCPEHISGMCAPLSMGRGGCLLLMRGEGSARYSAANLSLLAMFALHGTSAFENLRARRRMREMNLEIITSHVTSVEAKDVYTRGHSERVGQFAVLLGHKLGLPERDLERLRFAGILHDVGKIGIPDGILNKPGRLTEDEFARMRQHPVYGRDIVSKISSLCDIVPIIYHHHERVDGTGYPDGLAGDSIPFLARLISVVDGFEAMTSERSYQQARTTEQALEILRQNAGTQWDSAMVDAWCSVVERDYMLVSD